MNFDKIAAFLNSIKSDYGLGSYGCSIHVKGEEVFRAGTDIHGKDIFRFYSCTKPVTGFAAMQLIEQNHLGLYESVSKYLPAFKYLTCMKDGKAVPCENELKIWHLLTMSGGFDYNDEFPEMHSILDGKGFVPSEEALSLLADRPLSFEPGTHYQYSLGLDILGSVIEKISGLRLDEYMKKNIFTPIGAKDLMFFPNEEQTKRMCPLYLSFHREKEIYSNTFLHANHFPSGGCGLCGTVDDYMLFLDTLANDGVTKSGERILRSETMNLFNTQMLPDQCQAELTVKNIESERQGLGVRVRPVNPLQGMYTGDGAAGAYCLADKKSGISMFFAAHVLRHEVFHKEIHPRLFHLMCEGLNIE